MESAVAASRMPIFHSDANLLRSKDRSPYLATSYRTACQSYVDHTAEKGGCDPSWELPSWSPMDANVGDELQPCSS